MPLLNLLKVLEKKMLKTSKAKLVQMLPLTGTFIAVQMDVDVEPLRTKPNTYVKPFYIFQYTWSEGKLYEYDVDSERWEEQRVMDVINFFHEESEAVKFIKIPTVAKVYA